MNIDEMTLARGRLAIEEASRSFLFFANVNLIDFGVPERGEQVAENELSIRFHVQRKLSGFALENAIESGQTSYIPKYINNFSTDVIEGSYRPHRWSWWSGWQKPKLNQRSTRSSPMRGGISISDANHQSYGTLGGLVFDRLNNDPMILSNWHVLAADWGALPGLRIYQPGRLDGGGYADTVATLTRDAMSVNLDAAVATLNGDRSLINDQYGLGSVQGVSQAHIGMEVVKSGRRTNITFGQVTGVGGIASMNYGALNRVIREVVTIDQRSNFEEVSAPGDSGSWWLDSTTREAIGLHFAGSNLPERALAMDMSSVLHALDVIL